MLADVVHGNDVGVVQRTGRARFLLESASLLIVMLVRRQDLDGHGAANLDVASAQDAPRSVATQLLLDGVAPAIYGAMYR